MTRLLIDENLPATLAALLPLECVHATDFGHRPTDLELWSIARAKDLIVLTRDSDFFDRLLLQGPPPKVIWIRLGNLRRKDLEGTLVNLWPAIESLLPDADLIEVHPGSIETFRHPGK